MVFQTKLGLYLNFDIHLYPQKKLECRRTLL